MFEHRVSKEASRTIEDIMIKNVKKQEYKKMIAHFKKLREIWKKTEERWDYFCTMTKEMIKANEVKKKQQKGFTEIIYKQNRNTCRDRIWLETSFTGK